VLLTAAEVKTALQDAKCLFNSPSPSIPGQDFGSIPTDMGALNKIMLAADYFNFGAIGSVKYFV